MKRKLLRCMTALSVVLFASCTSELALEGVPQAGVDGEEVEVTFSISPESNHVTMRDAGVGGPGQWQEYIGRGKNIDMLIYAVYEYNEKANENGSHYTLLKQYGQGAVDENFESTNIFENSEAYTASSTHTGQTIIDVSKTIQEGKAQSITLRLMRNKEYHIAFWAQSSNTAAFNTDNLEEVKVSYDEAKNNDELRDAFCKVESFSVSANSSTRTVILTRPMAQVNVGATSLTTTYDQSKIVLTGVSSEINVVEDKISGATTSATFALNALSEFQKSGENGTLKIDIDNDGDIDGTTKGTNESVQEVYKYLSMCYALVPAETTINDEDVSKYASSVLSKVEFYVNNDTNQKFEITSVPVHRNWRTNILWDNDDDDSGNGDDDQPNEGPVIVNVNIKLDSTYEGDYNTTDDGENWTQGKTEY